MSRIGMLINFYLCCRGHSLPRLQELNLRDNDLREVPTQVCEVRSLKKLVLWNCLLEELPERYKNLSRFSLFQVRRLSAKYFSWDMVINEISKAFQVSNAIKGNKDEDNFVLTPTGLFKYLELSIIGELNRWKLKTCIR